MFKGVFSSATHKKHSCTQLKTSTYLTFSAGPFSLALSLALFPSSPSWTNSSSKFISSSSTRCSSWMLAAMLARALMTAKEQCLRRKNSYEQAIPQVLYFQCFLHNTDNNSCSKATDILSPRFFSCCFYEQHITLLTIEMQLVFKWKTIFKLCLWGCSIYDAVMVTRKVLSCGRQKAAKGSVSVLGKLLSRRIKLLSVVKAEIALLKHTDRNSPLSCSPLHWKVSSLPQLPTESVIIF